MASVSEIRERMRSIEQTMKITNAMYLISSSKLQKARKQLHDVEPYFEKTLSTIADILRHSPELEHPYFDQRPGEAHKVGYLVVTADKGLAGAYNHNITRLAEERVAASQNATLFVIGQMGRHYFAHRSIPVDGEFLYTAQDPTIYRAREIAETLIDLFLSRRLDEIHLLFTRMVTPLKLEPEAIQLLPLRREEISQLPRRERYVEIANYVPSPDAVLDKLVPSYVKAVVFGALVESFSSEQSARMTAMDTATKSARDMIGELSLLFNRARQAAITQEITEIVSGANAL